MAPKTFSNGRLAVPGDLGPDGVVQEITLWLLSEHLAALVAAASCRGLTTGQLLRRLVEDMLAREGFLGPDHQGQRQNCH